MIKTHLPIVALLLGLAACQTESASSQASVPPASLPAVSQVPGLVGGWRQVQHVAGELPRRALLRIEADGSFDMTDTVGKASATGACTRTWGVWERKGDSLILEAHKAERRQGDSWRAIRPHGRRSGLLRMVGDSLELIQAHGDPIRLERLRPGPYWAH